MKPTKKKMPGRMTFRKAMPLRNWMKKAHKKTGKQSGGFLSLIIAGLVAAGVSASTAAAAASVIAPVAAGAAGALGAYGANRLIKKIGGSRRKPLRISRRVR
jgi:NAD(P)H-hydrate repair Nnr-like enzyme with NAD(P)H-hydrate dehydratase domain